MDSSRHASARVISDSIFDIIYQYIELFFRSEKLQQCCYLFAQTIKKILIGGSLEDILLEAARQINLDIHLLKQMEDSEAPALALISFSQHFGSIQCLA